MPSSKDTGEDQKLADLIAAQREAVGNALAALQGQQASQSFVTFTFEEAVQAQIERIEGKQGRTRPSELERVDRVEQVLVQAAEQLKQLPDSAFLEPEKGNDVNSTE